MLHIPYMQNTMRRSLIGANATDPVLPERSRSGSRPRRGRPAAPERRRFARPRPVASRSS
jgi:hypothetical protein